MARRLGGHPIKHPEVARQCRSNPGEWVFVKMYPSRETAKTYLRYIEKGKTIAAYLPAGSFQAKCEPVDEGYNVFARYVGEQK